MFTCQENPDDRCNKILLLFMELEYQHLMLEWVWKSLDLLAFVVISLAITGLSSKRRNYPQNLVMYIGIISNLQPQDTTLTISKRVEGIIF